MCATHNTHSQCDCNPTLTHTAPVTLTLTLTALGPFGIGHIMHGVALRRIATLIHLDLTCCDISREDTEVSLGLWGLRSAAQCGVLNLLVTLNLENNNLNDQDGVFIVELLPQMPRLEELCLEDNCLQDTTAAALASFATRRIRPALQSLHLRDNFITWHGAEELNDVLLMNLFPALAVLTVGLNHLSAVHMSILYDTRDTLRLHGQSMYIDFDAYDHNSDGVSDESGL